VIRPTSFQAAAASSRKFTERLRFDLSAEEWAATRELLLLVRAELHKRLAPDGYTLGWNDQAGLHPHLHVIPRFDDEPMADQGVRSAIKDPANRRPDPWRPGTGRHMAGS
jgi:diadenosine tetraphosphate (Ap4A) HIT family hydrolase